jgi:type I restriction enzyme S subunit
MNEFKETEVGLIPEDWDVVKLGKVAEIKYGYRTAIPKSSANNGIPIVTMAEMTQDGSILWSKIRKIEIDMNIVNKHRLRSGEVLFNWRNSPDHVGKTAVFDSSENIPYICASFILRIMPNQHIVHNCFIHYFILFLKSKGYFAMKSRRAVGQTNFNATVLRNLTICCPPLPEQKKIAAVLSAVQEAKEKTEQVIKATKELKKSLMKHLFTYGPVSVEKAERVSLKETEIGTVPEEWEVVRLGDVVNKTRQKDPRSNPISDFKYIDVSSIDRETLTIGEYKTYQNKDAPSRARKLVEKEDIIFATVRPTLKRLALVDERFDGEICSTAFCVLRAKDGMVKPAYLFYAVSRESYIEELGKIQRGASYPAVTDSDVKNQKIPRPHLPEQEKIAEILSAVDQKIEAGQNKKKAVEELFKTLLNNLMTGKIRVNDLEIKE